MTTSVHAKIFVKEFIRDKKDYNIPLSDTYIMYVDFMRSRYPNEKLITEQSFHRMTTDYFYKRPGMTNNKAVCLEQLEGDLIKKQTAIYRNLEILRRISKNRAELLNEN